MANTKAVVIRPLYRSSCVNGVFHCAANRDWNLDWNRDWNWQMWFHCAENRHWKLIFISRGHVLCDWQWCKIDVKDRMFYLADETNGRRWRWRIYECSCCTCCICYDRLSSEHVLVITSCTACVPQIFISSTHFPKKKSAWVALPIFCTVEPVT